MASESERDDFQQILQQIGGKSNIHLISAVSGPDGDSGILKDFIADMFNDNMHEETTDCIGSSNGEIKIQNRDKTDPIGAVQTQSDRSDQSSLIHAHCTKSVKPEEHKNKTVISSKNISGEKRSIKCSVIIFIFRHDYVCKNDNKVCLREILKDVRARVKRNALSPALLGLIHTDCSRSQNRESVDLLDRSLRSVFIDYPQQAIWTGHYVTKNPDVLYAIKINACKVIKSSLYGGSSSDDKGGMIWPLTCLPGIFRKGKRGQADIISRKWQQDNTQTTEEGIPLQIKATSQ